MTSGDAELEGNLAKGQSSALETLNREEPVKAPVLGRILAQRSEERQLGFAGFLGPAHQPLGDLPAGGQFFRREGPRRRRTMNRRHRLQRFGGDVVGAVRPPLDLEEALAHPLTKRLDVTPELLSRL